MKNLQPIAIAFLLILAVILSSCSMSLVKRRYSPGYHVEVVKPHNRREHQPLHPSTTIMKVENKLVPLHIQGDTLVKAQVSKLKPVILPQQQHITPRFIKHPARKNPLDDSCDVVYLVTGERINAIVIEIGEDYVQYKKCDDLKGRLYTTKTKMINNITLRNGEYYIPKDSIIVDKDKERKKSNTLFIMSIVAISLAGIALLLSFFIGAAAGLSFGFSVFDLFFTFVLMLLNIRPGKYAPSYRTKFTWIFTVLAFILAIAALVIVLL